MSPLILLCKGNEDLCTYLSGVKGESLGHVDGVKVDGGACHCASPAL